MSKSRSPAGAPSITAAAASSSRSSTGGCPATVRLSTSRAFSLGRNSPAIFPSTRHTSAALHTLGREHLAFSKMSRAIPWSAHWST